MGENFFKFDCISSKNSVGRVGLSQVRFSENSAGRVGLVLPQLPPLHSGHVNA